MLTLIFNRMGEGVTQIRITYHTPLSSLRDISARYDQTQSEYRCDMRGIRDDLCLKVSSNEEMGHRLEDHNVSQA